MFSSSDSSSVAFFLNPTTNLIGQSQTVTSRRSEMCVVEIPHCGLSGLACARHVMVSQLKFQSCRVCFDRVHYGWFPDTSAVKVMTEVITSHWRHWLRNAPDDLADVHVTGLQRK